MNRQATEVRSCSASKELRPELWHRQAVCAQTDPEAFFPDKGESSNTAKRICLSCTVRAECLEFALNNDQRFGVWGGMTARERRRFANGDYTTRRTSGR